jgi:hypothetical protein
MRTLSYRIGVLPLTLVVFGLALLLMVLPVQLRPANFPADDSYFYQQVAHNVASGFGSTFSRITPTNGYHPLWMVLCIPLHLITGGNKVLALHVVFAFQSVLSIAIGLVFLKITRLFAWRFPWVGLAMLSVFFLTGMYGSEAHINGFMLICTICSVLVAYGKRSLTIWLIAGLCGAGAVLARLDNVFVVGCLTLFVLWISWGDLRAKRAASIVIFIAPIAVLIGAYLAFNRVVFGHFMPISGAIKSGFPYVVGSLNNLPALGRVTSLSAMLCMVMALLFMRDRIRRGMLVAL